MACRGTRGASPSRFRAPKHPLLVRDRTEAHCCARQRIHRPLLRISVRTPWGCFLFGTALTRVFNHWCSPATDRSVPVAIYFKFGLAVSPCIRARRREFSASVAFSDVRCWRKPSRELAGANHAAATEPQCDAASCQDGQRIIKGWRSCADTTPLTMLSNHFWSTHLLSYSSSAGAVPFLNSVPFVHTCSLAC